MIVKGTDQSLQILFDRSDGDLGVGTSPRHKGVLKPSDIVQSTEALEKSQEALSVQKVFKLSVVEEHLDEVDLLLQHGLEEELLGRFDVAHEADVQVEHEGQMLHVRRHLQLFHGLFQDAVFLGGLEKK